MRNWNKFKVIDLCTLVRGSSPRPQGDPRYYRGPIPRLMIEDITRDGMYVTPRTDSLTEEGALLSRPMKKGDLVLTVSGRTGVPAILSVDACIHDGFVGFRDLDKRVNVEYLYRYLSFLTERTNDKSVGAIFKNLTTDQVKNIEIPLPPMHIQERIADTLDKADSLRRKEQELLTKYDQLAQSIFYNMIGDLSQGSSKYPVSSIGKEIKVKGGKRLSKGEMLVKHNTGFPYIKAGNIKNGKVTTTNLEYLLPETQKKINRYTVKSGDVCVTIVGANIGDVGIVPRELDGANLTENAAKLVIVNPKRLDNVYLSNYWSMPFVQNLVKIRAMAVGVPKLALFRIEEIDLVLPPIDLQKRFNKTMGALNNQRELIQSQKLLSNNLFNNYLNSFFPFF